MLTLHAFELHSPSTLDEALALLARHAPRVALLAGGTDLVVGMKLGLQSPRHVVSLRSIDALYGVTVDRSTIEIGAMTSLETVTKHVAIREHAAALVEAAASVGGPHHRRMGTLGGNLCLDTRCRFYDQSETWREALGFCIKKDGDVCHVVEGGSRCVATASNDTAAAAVALDAEIVLLGAGGVRTIPASSFWVSDGAHNLAKEDHEIVIAMKVPIVAQRRSAYEKLRRRGAIDFPLLSVAVRRDPDDLAIVVSAVASKPRRIRLASNDPEHVAEAVWKQCHPLATTSEDAVWRRDMSRVLVRRALARAS